MDPDDSKWSAYEAVLKQAASWSDERRLVLLSEDSPDLAKWPVLQANSVEWMEDAKRIAVAGYRQVLKDGKDVCNSESGAEYSDHGEELSGMTRQT
jgi:hypothetical protein